MKSFFVTWILSVVISIHVFGQNNLWGRTKGALYQTKPFWISLFSNKNVYKTKQSVEMKKVYEIAGKNASADTTTFTLQPDREHDFYSVKYKVMKEDDEGIYIRILPHVRFIEHEILPQENEPPSDNANPYYFKIEKDDLLPGQKYLATERIMGMPITLPVKFRKEDGNLRGQFELSIGYAFGYRIRVNNNPYRDNYINIVPYGFAFNEDQYKANPDDEEEDSFSLTYWASGITYEFQGFNIGAFVGKDRMFDDRSDWIYQDELWLSFGLGYKFGSND